MPKRVLSHISLISALFAVTGVSQERPLGTATPEDLGGGVYVLPGPEGNILVSTGDDGTFVLGITSDTLDQETIRTVRSVKDAPIRFIAKPYIPTYSIDEDFGSAGGLVVLDNDHWKRMNHRQLVQLVAGDESLTSTSPRVVALEEGASLYWNDLQLEARHSFGDLSGDNTVMLLKGPNIAYLWTVSATPPFSSLRSIEAIRWNTDNSTHIVTKRESRVNRALALAYSDDLWDAVSEGFAGLAEYVESRQTDPTASPIESDVAAIVERGGSPQLGQSSRTPMLISRRSSHAICMAGWHGR